MFKQVINGSPNVDMQGSSSKNTTQSKPFIDTIGGDLYHGYSGSSNRVKINYILK
jgi:hypothetical protein